MAASPSLPSTLLHLPRPHSSARSFRLPSTAPASPPARTSFTGSSLLLKLKKPTLGAGAWIRMVLRDVARPRNGWSSPTVMALIGPECSQAVFCVMASCAALSQLVETRTNWGAQISAPLLAMGAGMILSGAHIIPNASPTYDFVSTLVMPMSLALCLLETDIQQAFFETGSTLKAFWYGALGTIIGTFISFKIVGRALGTDGWKIASSLCASYIGGSINYAATAQALGLSSASMLAAGMAADNLAMAAYFAVIMSIPDDAEKHSNDGLQEELLVDDGMGPTTETIALSLASAAVACAAGSAMAGVLPSSFAGCGLAITALVASFFSSIGARVFGVSKNASVRVFAGSQTLGSSFMLFFFFVVGSTAGLQEALSGGWPLLTFITILMIVHLGVILSLGCWSQLSMRTVLVASNANIGGPATAAAMAQCRHWRGLVRPALLVGTLGYTVATAIGCVVGLHLLRP